MNENNKPRIILLSDMWGNIKSSWISNYITILEKHYDVKYYDSCDLGGIDKSDSSEKELHYQFVNGGVEKAVESLLQKEKGSVSILGFSMGGFIGWKASLSGLKSQNLFAISSTRLRYETLKPSGKINLFYGENDMSKPNIDWFNALELKENIYKSEKHEMYKKEKIATDICKLIIHEYYAS